MIQTYTNLKAVDNTGAKVIRCIGIPGGTGRKYGGVGDVIVASVRQAAPRSQVKKGDIVRAVVVRIAQNYRRPDGS